jgi:hypothetical protein
MIKKYEKTKIKKKIFFNVKSREVGGSGGIV